MVGTCKRRLEEIASRAAGVLGVASAEIKLGSAKRPPKGASPLPLEAAGRAVGTLYTPEGADPNVTAQQRFLPALAALLAVAVDRARLEGEALEAEALRRSDLVKTALLRAVSHDLRTPLTGVRTAVGALRNPTLRLSDEDRAELLETIEEPTARPSRPARRGPPSTSVSEGAAAPDQELWSLDDLVREAVDSLGARTRVDVVGEWRRS